MYTGFGMQLMMALTLACDRYEGMVMLAVHFHRKSGVCRCWHPKILVDIPLGLRGER